MSITALIQARSTSTRLPGKCIKPLLDVDLWRWSYITARQVFDRVIMVIPTNDLPMLHSLREAGLGPSQWFEGDKDDVLKRYVDCVEHHKLDAVCRLTSDCPMISLAEMHYMASVFTKLDLDFSTNVKFAPDGQDVEIISKRLLMHVHEQATGIDREHVTIHIKKNWKAIAPHYKLWSDSGNPYLKRWIPKMSIDTLEDYHAVEDYMLELRKVSGDVDFGDGHNRGSV